MQSVTLRVLSRETSGYGLIWKYRSVETYTQYSLRNNEKWSNYKREGKELASWGFLQMYDQSQTKQSMY